MIIVLFVTIFIPLYTFNFYVNNLGANKNRREIYQSITNSLHSYNSLYEGEFRKIQTSILNVTSEIALLYMDNPVFQSDEPEIILSSPEKTKLITNMKKQLTQILTSSRFVEKAHLYLPKLKEVISYNETVSLNFNEAEYTDLMERQPFGTVFNRDECLFFSAPYTYQTDDNKDAFAVKVVISIETIRKQLDNISSYSDSGVILFHLDQGWYVSTKDNPEIISSLLNSYSRSKPAFLPDHTRWDNSNPKINYINIDNISYIATYEYSDFLDSVMLFYARKDDVFVPLKTYRNFFIIMTVLSVIAIFLFSTWLYNIIHKPLKEFVTAFRRVEKGELGFALEYVGNNEFGYLYESFNHMLLRLDSLIQEISEQKVISQRSELKRLQSQINPHLLYNSFFILSRLIHSKNIDKASQFAKYLGQYFQFVTRDAEDEITLETEVRYARNYTDIQTICHPNRIQLDFAELPEKYAKIIVPRLILQPVIENSYKYAFENKLSGAKLVISFKEANEGLVTIFTISVEDNGDDLGDDKIYELQKMLKSNTSNMNGATGLFNVFRRIRLIHGAKCVFNISRSPLGGLKVEICLCIENEELK